MALVQQSSLLNLDITNAGEPGLFYAADLQTTYNLDKTSAGEPELTQPAGGTTTTLIIFIT